MKRDFYICELAWTPTPDPAAKSCCGAVAPRIISLPPTLPARAFAPKRADPRRSKNARKETRSGGEKRPLRYLRILATYGQPVLCPMGTSTPLLVRTFRRTRAPAPWAPWNGINLRAG